MRQISGILLNPSFLALVILFGLLFLQAAFYFLGLPWSRPVTLAFYLTSAMWALGCAWAVRRTWLGFNKIDAFFVAFVCFLALSLGASNLTSEVDQRLWGFLLFMVVVPYVCGRSLGSTTDLQKMQVLVLIAGLAVMPLLLVDRLMMSAVEYGRFAFFGMNHSPLMVGGLLAATLIALHSWILRPDLFEGARHRLKRIAGYTLLSMTTICLVWVSARGWLLAGIFGSLAVTVIASQVKLSKRITLVLGILLIAALSMKLLHYIDSNFGAVYSVATNSITEYRWYFYFFDSTHVLEKSTPVLGSASCLSFEEGDDSISMRWVLYQEAIAMFLQRPLLGVGAGLFGWYSCTGYGGFPHSTVLQLISELGAIGGGIFIILLVLTAAKLVENVRNAQSIPESRSIAFFASLFLSVFIADQIYGNYFLSMAFWLLIGSVANMRGGLDQKDKVNV